MTPKIMLDSLRSDWVERRSKERVIATSQNTEEEDKAQQAGGSCEALTRALYDLNHLPDRENPSLGTFEILEQLIASRLDYSEDEELNMTPADQGFKLMEIIGVIEEFRLILQDIRRKQAVLVARDEETKPKRKDITTIENGYVIEFWAEEGHLRQPGFFPVFMDAKRSADEQQEEADGQTRFTEARFVVLHGDIVVYLSEIIKTGGIGPDQNNSKNQM